MSPLPRAEPGSQRAWRVSRRRVFIVAGAGAVVWGARVRGLDTGCVYGKRLSGLWWPEDKLVQVEAARVYCPVEERQPSEARKEK